MMESFNEELGKLISDKWTKAAVDIMIQMTGNGIKTGKVNLEANHSYATFAVMASHWR